MGKNKPLKLNRDNTSTRKVAFAENSEAMLLKGFAERKMLNLLKDYERALMLT